MTAQRRRDLHAQYATADYHRRAGDCQDVFNIRQGAKGEYLRALNTRQRRDKRLRPGGEHQFIPFQPVAADAQPPPRDIHFADRLAKPHADTMLGVPLRRQQLDLRRRFFPAEYRRELNAVVGRLRFIADKRDDETPLRARRQLLCQPGCRHTVADNYQSPHHSALGRFRLLFVEEMEDLLTQVVVVVIFRQLDPVTRTRQINVKDLADRRGRSIGHH